MLGHTSEDVAKSIEDGSFGMAEETGADMNRAIRQGARDGLGMGEALGRWLAASPPPLHPRGGGWQARRLPRGWGLRLTATTACSTTPTGCASPTRCTWPSAPTSSTSTPSATSRRPASPPARTSRVFCAAVCDLEGGVFCNFGSAVMGPEVFLKALSIARNLGHPLREITTANFDLVPLERRLPPPAPKDRPEYYYRPKKNIVIRPVSLGGRGYHIVGDHRARFPTWRAWCAQERRSGGAAGAEEQGSRTHPGSGRVVANVMRAIVQVRNLQSRNPQSLDDRHVAPAFRVLSAAFRTAGPSSSAATAAASPMPCTSPASWTSRSCCPRPIPEGHRQRLAAQPGGEALAGALQRGLRTVALGANPALASAVENDSPQRGMGFAQELYALARPGDVLLAISTSGEAQNVLNAVSVAKALGLSVIALTGERESRLSAAADVVLRAPATETAEVQGWHIRMYHAPLRDARGGRVRRRFRVGPAACNLARRRRLTFRSAVLRSSLAREKCS